LFSGRERERVTAACYVRVYGDGYADYSAQPARAGDIGKAAEQEGTGVSSFVGQVATAEAKRRETVRIRSQLSAIAEKIASDPELQAEIEEWGTPDPEVWGHDGPMGRW